MSNPGGSSGGGVAARGKPYAFGAIFTTDNKGTGIGNPETFAVGIAIPAGQLAVLGIGIKNGILTNTFAVTDSKGNVWTIGADHISGVAAAGSPIVALAYSVITTPLLATDTISIAGAGTTQNDIAVAIATFTAGSAIPLPAGDVRHSLAPLAQGARLRIPFLGVPTGGLIVCATGSGHAGDSGDATQDVANDSGFTELANVANGQGRMQLAYKVASGNPEVHAMKTATNISMVIASLVFA